MLPGLLRKQLLLQGAVFALQLAQGLFVALQVVVQLGERHPQLLVVRPQVLFVVAGLLVLLLVLRAAASKDGRLALVLVVAVVLALLLVGLHVAARLGAVLH